uniref:Uncharacterized protein n=1 Tax=Romanomermis culicivorax TaxID=13658 RepID=A0A915KSJ5_ROMCU
MKKMKELKKNRTKRRAVWCGNSLRQNGWRPSDGAGMAASEWASPYSALIHRLILDSVQVDPAKRPDIDSMMAVLKFPRVENSQYSC